MNSNMAKTWAVTCGVAVLAGVAWCTGSGAAGQGTPESGKKLLTPEAALNLRSIGELELSPDGERLAFVVTEPAKGTGRARHIWMYERGTGVTRQFTYSDKSESSPKWSADGKELAFLSNREGEQQQIYVMRGEGGEGRALTKGKKSVKAFEWSADGKRIAFLAPAAKTEEEEKKEKDKDDARAVDKDDKHTRLWLIDTATGEERAITKPEWDVDELAWLPAGEGVVVKATEHPESDQDTDRILAVKLADGTMRQLTAPRGPFGELKVSMDGKVVSFVGCREDGPAPHDLMILPAGEKVARNVTATGLDRAVEEYQWLRNGTVALLAADGFETKFVEVNTGATREMTPSPGVTAGFAMGANGEVFYVSQSATKPQEVWRWDGKSAAKQISNVNESWKELRLSVPEFYKYKSFDGMEIGAALLNPVGEGSGAKPPLVALIHGGPTGRWSDAIDTWGQLLAANGYAVFYPNIRGSSGYGEKFIEANRGDWGGGDFQDVMAGVKDLVDREIVDGKRLGIGGWSYGGYMTDWAITQTNEFKAAVSGAGLANLISEYGTEEHPSYDEWFYGLPYEKPEGFLNSSPFLHLKNVKTPTLFLQGETDTVDPPGQSTEMYRGLKRYGVETELVMYPREPHGFHEEKHLLDRMQRILAWYDKYLKGAGAAAGATGVKAAN